MTGGWIYHSDEYYEAFLMTLDEAHERFKAKIHAYCLMGNHYHLLVRTPRGNLSRAMRHVNGVYTQYHNYLKKTDGPLFRGRYKAINIEASGYLLEVSRYIHRNPVETKKPLAERLVNYRWSSYPAYLNKAECPDWLYRSAVYEELGSGQAVRSYTRFVEQGNDEETEKFYARGHWPAVRGSENFADKAYLLSNVDGKEARKRERTVIFSEVILSAVCDRMKCDKEVLLFARRGRGVDNRARGMAMKLCLEQGSMKLSEMAKLFNVSSDSAVSRSVSRFDALFDSDLEIAGLFESICQELTP